METYTITGDQAVAFVLITSLSMLAIAAVVGLLQGRVIGRLTDAVTNVINDRQRTGILESRFDKLPTEQQTRIKQLIDVADPLTNFVPGQLDNDVLAWLREITDGVAIGSKDA